MLKLKQRKEEKRWLLNGKKNKQPSRKEMLLQSRHLLKKLKLEEMEMLNSTKDS